jgi:type IV pilus assembly protein PilM
MGGIVLTKALSTEHNLAIQQAEEYKRAYGLNVSQMDGQIAKTLSTLIDPFITEINGSMTFFKERYPEEVISKIVLIGGGALLPGLSPFIQQRTQVDTMVGNPWAKTTMSQQVSSQMKGFECIFSIATGLAIRDLE